MDGNNLTQKNVSENLIYSFWSIVIIIGIFCWNLFKGKKTFHWFDQKWVIIDNFDGTWLASYVLF